MSGANGGEGGPAGMEKINTEIVTLTRFLNEEQTKHKEATGDFTYSLPIEHRAIRRNADNAVWTGYYATPSNSPSSRSPTTSEEHP